MHETQTSIISDSVLKCSAKNVMPIETSKIISKDKGQDCVTAQERPSSSELQLTVQILGEKV